MNNEEFKNKVRTALTEFGILAENDTSIFSTDKVIQNETDDSVMLVGPNRETWVWLGAMMPEKDFADGIEQFKRAVTASFQEAVKVGARVNPNISVKDFLEGIAKIFGGKAPTENIGTATLSVLVNEAMTPVNEAVEGK